MDMNTEKGTDHNIAAQVFPNITHYVQPAPRSRYSTLLVPQKIPNYPLFTSNFSLIRESTYTC